MAKRRTKTKTKTKKRRTPKRHPRATIFGVLTKRQYAALVKYTHALGEGDVGNTEAMLRTHGYRRRKTKKRRRS